MFKPVHLNSKFVLKIMLSVLLLCVSCNNTQPNKENLIVNNTLNFELGWIYQSSVDIVLPPIENGENIIVALKNGIVMALNKRSGTLQWQYDTGQSELYFFDSTAKIFADEQYVAGVFRDSQLFLLDAANGQEIGIYDLTSNFRRVPDVLISGDVIFVGGWLESTFAYLGAYQLQNGKLLWEETIFDSRSYDFLIPCEIDTSHDFSTVCLLVRGSIKIIRTNPAEDISVYDTVSIQKGSYEKPIVISGNIFMDPRPGPELLVIDLIEKDQYKLPADCTNVKDAKIPTNFENQLLIVDGCNDVYILPANNLRKSPAWIYHSDANLVSPFITSDGVVGYVLTEDKEIIGIDLDQGKVIGQIKIDNNNRQLLVNNIFTNSLLATDDTLVTLLDKRLILSFSKVE